jgi:hypothetical protein
VEVDDAAKEVNLDGRTAVDLDLHIKRPDGENRCADEMDDLISDFENEDEEADHEPYLIRLDNNIYIGLGDKMEWRQVPQSTC